MDARGLMAFYADIEASEVENYRRWHNCEHVLERVSIPGFVRGRRYVGYPGAPMFLMFYETEAPSVLASAAYRAALDSPTDWTRRALTWFRNPARAIYGLTGAAGAAPRTPAPFMATLRFNLDDEAVLAAWRGPVLAAIAGTPGVIRARLYEIDEAISGIATAERRIYGGGPGEQRLLAFVELSDPDAPLDLAAPPGLAAAQAAAQRDMFSDRFWLDFALDAKGAVSA